MAEEKGVTEDEMVGWHHWFNGHELGQTTGHGEGQGSLTCCSPWDTKSWTWAGDWTTATIYRRLLSCAGIKKVILLLQQSLNVQLGSTGIPMTRNTQLLTWCLSKANSHLVLMPWCLAPGSTFTPQVCVTRCSLSRNLKLHPEWRNKALATRNFPGSLRDWEFSETSSELQDWPLDLCKLPCPVSYSIFTPDPFRRVGYSCLFKIPFPALLPRLCCSSVLWGLQFSKERKWLNAQGIQCRSTGRHLGTMRVKVAQSWLTLCDPMD